LRFPKKVNLPQKGERVTVKEPWAQPRIGIVEKANLSWIWVRMDGPDSEPKPKHLAWCTNMQGQPVG
jgi:hypothetical protein